MAKITINSYTEQGELVLTTQVELADVEAEELRALQAKDPEELTDSEIGILEAYEERLSEMEGEIMGKAGIVFNCDPIALVEYVVEEGTCHSKN